MTQMSPPVDQRPAWWATTAFYAVVVAVAGIGNVTATWLPWEWLFKIPAVAALELGGVVLAINADTRRRLGESAYAWRIASAAVAAVAVAINWFGHQHQPVLALFFTTFSAVGYVIYLIRSGDSRRDQLRAEKKLPPTSPAYGPVQWLCAPKLTHEARALARQHGLGLFESLDAATSARRQAATARAEAARRREAHAALRVALADLLVANVPEARRPVALATYDLDVMVEAMRAEVDNAQVGRMLAQSLTTDRVTARRTPADPARPAAPRRQVRAAPVKATASGSRERVDPLVRHADRISAVQAAIPDWRTRPGRITVREIGEYAGVGGRETQRRVRELIEALSDRGPVP